MQVLRAAGYEPQTETAPQQVNTNVVTSNKSYVKNLNVQPNGLSTKPKLPPRAGEKKDSPANNSPKGNIDYE